MWVTGRLAVEGPGGLLVERDLPARQGRLALTYLVLNRHRAVTAEELAEGVWSGAQPEAWQVALRATLSRLRRALETVGLDGRETLASSFGCYQLVLGPCWVDVEAAADGVHRAEHAWTARDAGTAVGWARVAVAQTGSPLLSGQDDDWVLIERDRLTELRVRALTVLSQVWQETGDAPMAVRDAREVAALRPHRDTSCRLLMQAHSAAGNPAEALRTYEKFRHLLDRELGVLPDAATRELHARLLAVL